jgi:hypothetical protein
MDILDKLDILIEDVDGINRSKEEETKIGVMDFLKDNPVPSDDEIIKIAKDLDIDVNVLNRALYKILESFAGHGRAKRKGFEEKDADSEQLRLGTRIESEHTNWTPMAKRIALDHLAEIPDYYDRLIKMEKDAGIKV